MVTIIYISTSLETRGSLECSNVFSNQKRQRKARKFTKKQYADALSDGVRLEAFLHKDN